jgi:cytochrome c553
MRGRLEWCFVVAVVLGVGSDLFGTPAGAQSIEEKTQICASCHGADGMEREDMLAIAEYFSKKPWPDLGQPRASKEIADRALSANRSVGCTGCHLDQFQGDGTVPRLAGQSRDYLTKTIADLRARARGNNPGMSDLMLATAPDDLAALTEYLAGR